MVTERLPSESDDVQKWTKTTREVERTSEETHETRSGRTGKYEKRVVTSETRESKTTETFESSAGGAGLPVPADDMPRQVRLIVLGVVPSRGGCADGSRLNGDYILDLVEQHSSCWVWQRWSFLRSVVCRGRCWKRRATPTARTICERGLKG
ncbi:MAG: hypothetical protein WD065_15300 [Planctomycetaceae bacterium]